MKSLSFISPNFTILLQFCSIAFSGLFSIPHDNLAFYFLAINCCNTLSYAPYLCLYFCLSLAFLPVLEGQSEWWQSLLLFKSYTSAVHWNIFSLNSIKQYWTNYSLLSLPHFLLPVSLKLKTINHRWKKSKRTQTDREIYRVHGLEELILSKWLYYPKQSIDSMQSLSSYQRYFSQN